MIFLVEHELSLTCCVKCTTEMEAIKSFSVTSILALLTLFTLQHIQCSCRCVKPFGSKCGVTTKCGKFGTYVGGVGNCNSNLCICRVGKRCKNDNKCCSGKCENRLCAKSSRFNDPCHEGTCDTDKGYDCALVPVDNVSLVKTKSKKWGLCKLTKAMWNQCDNETFCRGEVSWPGGWQNCYNGRCDCKFKSPCESHRECCSNWCQDDQCQASTVGGFCHRTEGKICFHKHGCTGKSWRLGNMGICENCTKIGQPCNNETYCCSVGHWPGGYGNCLNNICNCKVVGECLNDKECCSSHCVANSCSKGNLFDICEKEPNSCNMKFDCNSPSNDVSVRNHFQLTKGTCKATLSTCGRQAIEPQFTAVSQSKIVKKIRNGEDAIPNSWPWMLNVRYRQTIFSAVLIHPRYALTAAHLIYNETITNVREVRVSLASHWRIDSDSRIVGVDTIVNNPEFRVEKFDLGKNDITILQLSEAVELGTKINLVCLTENTYPDGYECVTTGWGRTNHSERVAPQLPLQQVKVNLFSNHSECKVDGVICSKGTGGTSYVSPLDLFTTPDATDPVNATADSIESLLKTLDDLQSDLAKCVRRDTANSLHHADESVSVKGKHVSFDHLVESAHLFNALLDERSRSKPFASLSRLVLKFHFSGHVDMLSHEIDNKNKLIHKLQLVRLDVSALPDAMKGAVRIDEYIDHRNSISSIAHALKRMLADPNKMNLDAVVAQCIKTDRLIDTAHYIENMERDEFKYFGNLVGSLVQLTDRDRRRFGEWAADIKEDLCQLSYLHIMCSGVCNDSSVRQKLQKGWIYNATSFILERLLEADEDIAVNFRSDAQNYLDKITDIQNATYVKAVMQSRFYWLNVSVLSFSISGNNKNIISSVFINDSQCLVSREIGGHFVIVYFSDKAKTDALTVFVSQLKKYMNELSLPHWLVNRCWEYKGESVSAQYGLDRGHLHQQRMPAAVLTQFPNDVTSCEQFAPPLHIGLVASARSSSCKMQFHCLSQWTWSHVHLFAFPYCTV